MLALKISVRKNEQYLPNLSQTLFAACPSLKSSFMWKCQDGLVPKWHFSPWHSEKDEKELYRPWDHSSQSWHLSHMSYQGLKWKRASCLQPAHPSPSRCHFLWLSLIPRSWGHRHSTFVYAHVFCSSWYWKLFTSFNSQSRLGFVSKYMDREAKPQALNLIWFIIQLPSKMKAWVGPWNKSRAWLVVGKGWGTYNSGQGETWTLEKNENIP